MDDPAAILPEEAFKFPKYLALLDQKKSVAYSMGLVDQLHVSQIVPVQVGRGKHDQTVVYEYDVKVNICTAVLIRSAWLRPVGSMDGAAPFNVQVLFDGVPVLTQPIDEHLWAWKLVRSKPCACNGWKGNAQCKCPVPTLSCGPLEECFPAIALDPTPKAYDLGIQPGKGNPDKPYGIFAPNRTLVQIRAVNVGRGPISFKARCGLTAALYSTRKEDVKA